MLPNCCEHLSHTERHIVLTLAGDIAQKTFASYSVEQAVAHHEAGHAVVAILLGVMPRGASIIPDQESLGRTWFTEPDSDTGIKPRSDGRLAVLFLKIDGIESPEARRPELRRLQALTRQVVITYSPLIMAVSLALQKHLEMTGAQIEETMHTALARMERWYPAESAQ